MWERSTETLLQLLPNLIPRTRLFLLCHTSQVVTVIVQPHVHALRRQCAGVPLLSSLQISIVNCQHHLPWCQCLWTRTLLRCSWRQCVKAWPLCVEPPNVPLYVALSLMSFLAIFPPLNERFSPSSSFTFIGNTCEVEPC